MGRRRTHLLERLKITNEDGHSWQVSGGKQREREFSVEYCSEKQEERPSA